MNNANIFQQIKNLVNRSFLQVSHPECNGKHPHFQTPTQIIHRHHSDQNRTIFLPGADMPHVQVHTSTYVVSKVLGFSQILQRTLTA